ncbi:DUF4013 domain-containing protein [Methanobrevibacter filiformis]|uniref:Glycerophosphoryl diester phosphodiesterase membrane domain-containing protein n=1 Tax=Methanobrevibacter filiformis TaxID=55758 RepID=A0A166BQR3_9EURY|nr:DUF4013 domain-containing protein [Methanobrevibacter filiformis]KZX13691.1 hypothetical protein MBFIL_09870 [Methanobrevibacter filiformis]
MRLDFYLETIKENLLYPFNNIFKVVIIGVLCFIGSIIGIMLQALGIATNNVSVLLLTIIIAMIVLFVIYIFSGGYLAKITRTTIETNDETYDLPKFDVKQDIIEGLKLIVIAIAYYIIPVIIILTIAYVTNLLIPLVSVLIYLSSFAILNITTVPMLTELFVLSIIIFLIFTAFFTVAVGRFSETRELISALEFKEIIGILKDVEIKDFLVNFILMIVAIVILWLIGVGITFITGGIGVGFVATILNVVLIIPYIYVFIFKSIGSIYLESIY